MSIGHITSAKAPELDLYELARQNGDNTRARYEQTCEEAGTAATAIERFCRHVEHNGRVSINTRSRRLLTMLRTGSYPNPHDEARERALREGGESEEHLKQQQGVFYLRRVTFERSFVDGESFRYAALNLGGAGLSYYGLYCLVLRDPAADDPVAVLPANSAIRFMTDEPQLDITTLRQKVAPWAHRHHLAACKHAHEVAHVPEGDWPTMMCHATETEECFVEIILGSPVTPQALVEIRADEARLNELIDRVVTDTLSDAERIEVTDRLDVLEELRRHKLDTLYRGV